jgi:chromosomal replication initiator protein
MAAYSGHVHDQKPDLQVTPDSLALNSALKAAVAERLGESRFALWFGDGVHLGLSGDGVALEVQVPNAFFREWIKGHFATNLRDAAQAVIGRPVELNFAIRDEENPPYTDVVKPDAEHFREQTAGTVVVSIPGSPKSPLSSHQSPATAPDRRFNSRFAPPPSNRRQYLDPPGGTAIGPVSPAGSGEFLLAGRPPRRLDDFITGPSNQLAHAATLEMVNAAGTTFNPLLIHGGVGLGKTHLLEGVTRGLRLNRPGLNVLWLTAEAFTNSFLESMRAGSLGSFRNRHRGLGALAIDDIHFLAGTRATQSEFLHTFNALIERGAPIILTADQHPRRISRLSDELVTRFLGGMVVKLDPPDLATRRAILEARSSARGVSLPTAVLDYIAEHLRSSVRELEGALHSVIAHALLTGKRLDLGLAQAALRDMIRHTSSAVGLRDIERAVCQLFQVDSESLRSESRARALAYPRMLAMYLARKHTGAAYSEIGRHFGGRNHSTVISAEKKVRGWLRDEERSALLPGFETMADILVDLEQTLGA